jgi:hypothetical protein
MKMAKKPKVYIIKTEKCFARTNRENQVFYREGTLEELIAMFSYTLEIGNSCNKKINRNPKTITQFVSCLQRSFEEKEAACYDRTSVDLVDSIPVKEVEETK